MNWNKNRKGKVLTEAEIVEIPSEEQECFILDRSISTACESLLSKFDSEGDSRIEGRIELLRYAFKESSDGQALSHYIDIDEGFGAFVYSRLAQLIYNTFSNQYSRIPINGDYNLIEDYSNAFDGFENYLRNNGFE